MVARALDDVNMARVLMMGGDYGSAPGCRLADAARGLREVEALLASQASRRVAAAEGGMDIHTAFEVGQMRRAAATPFGGSPPEEEEDDSDFDPDDPEGVEAADDDLDDASHEAQKGGCA